MVKRREEIRYNTYSFVTAAVKAKREEAENITKDGKIYNLKKKTVKSYVHFEQSAKCCPGERS